MDNDKQCSSFVGDVNSSIGNSYRQCSRKARYYCSCMNESFCAEHLKIIRAFSKNPIEIESGKEIDRHLLYRSGKIEFIEEEKNK